MTPKLQMLPHDVIAGGELVYLSPDFPAPGHASTGNRHRAPDAISFFSPATLTRLGILAQVFLLL